MLWTGFMAFLVLWFFGIGTSTIVEFGHALFVVVAVTVLIKIVQRGKLSS
jgi:hypothetical protein